MDWLSGATIKLLKVDVKLHAVLVRYFADAIYKFSKSICNFAIGMTVTDKQ